jgi:glycosyltransferase involved in cell wall biosynthesis
VVRAALREQVAREAPAVLYLDHLDSLVYRNVAPGVPAILDLHNVYSELVRRTAAEQTSTWKRLYLRRESRLLARSERRAADLAAGLFAVSEDDASYFRQLRARSTYVVPNGVDCAAYESLPAARRLAPPTLLYVGCMSWGPNVAAAEFLATRVLPRVREAVPGAGLAVVGRDPTAAVRALGRLPGVEVTGAVPDVLPYLRAASALAVPLEAGGGTRLKILEAFAAGLPVVSTPVGCEGLGVAAGEHLVVADRDHFVTALVELLKDPAAGERLASRARRLARGRFDWAAVGRTACEAVHAVLRAYGARA